MLSDLENMDIMLGSNHFEREVSEFENSASRHESPTYDALLDHNTNWHSYSGANEIRRFAGNCQNSGKIDFSSEMNRLSGELNQKITQEIKCLMDTVSFQIQRTICEAIKEQVLKEQPQIQASLRSGSVQKLQTGWKIPAARSEYRSEGTSNRKVRSSSRDEFRRNPIQIEDEEDTHYSNHFTSILHLFTKV